MMESKTSFFGNIIKFYAGLLGFANNALDSNVTLKEDSSSKTYRTKTAMESYTSSYAVIFTLIIALFTLPIAILAGVWKNKYWRYSVLLLYAEFAIGLFLASSTLVHIKEDDVLFVVINTFGILFFISIMRKKGIWYQTLKVFLLVFLLAYVAGLILNYRSDLSYEKKYTAFQKNLNQENIQNLKTHGYYTGDYRTYASNIDKDSYTVYCLDSECNSFLKNYYRERNVGTQSNGMIIIENITTRTELNIYFENTFDKNSIKDIKEYFERVGKANKIFNILKEDKDKLTFYINKEHINILEIAKKYPI